MHTLSTLILILCPMILFGGFFDWFLATPKNEKIDFHCPHRCGEWGSESIRFLEWEFVQCLYNAQEMANFNHKNISQRGKEFRVKYSKNYIPKDFPFLDRPQNFESKWYQDILRETYHYRELSNCDIEWTCPGCISAEWQIVHFNETSSSHIGKKFIRNRVKEGYYYYSIQYDDDDDEIVDEDNRPFYQEKPKINEYTLGNYIDFNNACLALEEDLLLERNGGPCRNYHYSPLFVKQIEIRYAKVYQSLVDVRSSYQNIFVHCAKDHRSPSAFYNLALHALAKGDYDLSLEHFRSLFDNVKLDSLQKNLASELYQSMSLSLTS